MLGLCAGFILPHFPATNPAITHLLGIPVPLSHPRALRNPSPGICSAGGGDQGDSACSRPALRRLIPQSEPPPAVTGRDCSSLLHPGLQPNPTRDSSARARAVPGSAPAQGHASPAASTAPCGTRRWIVLGHRGTCAVSQLLPTECERSTQPSQPSTRVSWSLCPQPAWSHTSPQS